MTQPLFVWNIIIFIALKTLLDKHKNRKIPKTASKNQLKSIKF